MRITEKKIKGWEPPKEALPAVNSNSAEVQEWAKQYVQDPDKGFESDVYKDNLIAKHFGFDGETKAALELEAYCCDVKNPMSSPIARFTDCSFCDTENAWMRLDDYICSRCRHA